MSLIQKYKGKFKVTFSLSGIVINQFRLYAPEVLDSFKELAATGMVEFLAETDSHSLASLKDRAQFEEQAFDKFRFTACLQSVVVLPARPDNLFHYVLALVDL